MPTCPLAAADLRKAKSSRIGERSCRRVATPSQPAANRQTSTRPPTSVPTILEARGALENMSVMAGDVQRMSSDVAGIWRRSAATMERWRDIPAITSLESTSSSASNHSEFGYDDDYDIAELTASDESSSQSGANSGISDADTGSAAESDDDDALDGHPDPAAASGPQVRRQSGRRRPSGRPTGGWAACPHFHRWVKVRLGTPDNFISIVCFVLADIARINMEEWTQNKNNSPLKINNVSLTVMAHVSTMVVAVAMSIMANVRPGREGKINLIFPTFSLHFFWRWGIVAAMLTFSYFLQGWGVACYLDDLWVSMFRYSSLPFSIWIGRQIFRRTYGRLELLAASMMTLGIGAFWVLRVRCAEDHCRKMWVNVHSKMYLGMFLMLLSVFLGMAAWTGAEVLLKVKTRRLQMRGGKRDQAMWIMLAHFALCQALISGGIWIYHSLLGSSSILSGGRESPAWFGQWRLVEGMLCAIYVLHMCLSVHIIKHLSTVSWALIMVVSGVLAVCVSDPAKDQYHFLQRAAPSLLLAPTIVLSAVIFQTGRLNIRQMHKRLGIKESEVDAVDFCWPFRRRPPAASDLAGRLAGSSGGGRRPAEEEEDDGPPELLSPGQERRVEHSQKIEALACALEGSERPAFIQGKAGRAAVVLGTYSSVIVYIISQALRENFSQKAQSSRIIVPQSLSVMTAGVGLLVANLSVAWIYGREGLVAAWDFRKILKFLFAAFLFAMSAFLSSMAFALGASAPAKDAAGRVYTPVAALLSRWVLGKFYMWLEWIALMILTLSCMAFGLLDSSNQSSSIMGLVCAVASGAVSAVNSLVMERLMRGETDAYMMQSVRLSAGSFIFSALFVFVMGWIGDAESPPRLDFAFWNFRVLDDGCHPIGACDSDGVFRNSTVLGAEDALRACTCGKGLFVGWAGDADDAWHIYGAILSGVVYNFATGLVVKQFSSVYRSVADGIMLLFLYFVLTPWLDGAGSFPFDDMAKSMVVLMVPISGTTFSYAAAEMQKVMEVATLQHGLSISEAGAIEVGGAGEDDDEDALDGDSWDGGGGDSGGEDLLEDSGRASTI